MNGLNSVRVLWDKATFREGFIERWATLISWSASSVAIYRTERDQATLNARSVPAERRSSQWLYVLQITFTGDHRHGGSERYARQ